MSGYSRDFDRALVVSALVHEDAARKGTLIPYIVHPVHVATILLRHGYPEPLAVAAVLHDVIEDIDYANGRLQLALRATFPHSPLPHHIADPDEFEEAFTRFLEQEFDEGVLALVRAVTERKTADGRSRPWIDRKQETLEHLREASPEVLALKAADVIHNTRSILADMDHHGAAVFRRFTGSPAQTTWYYGEVARLAAERLGDAPIAHEALEATRELAARTDGVAP